MLVELCIIIKQNWLHWHKLWQKMSTNSKQKASKFGLRSSWHMVMDALTLWVLLMMLTPRVCRMCSLDCVIHNFACALCNFACVSALLACRPKSLELFWRANPESSAKFCQLEVVFAVSPIQSLCVDTRFLKRFLPFTACWTGRLI